MSSLFGQKLWRKAALHSIYLVSILSGSNSCYLSHFFYIGLLRKWKPEVSNIWKPS